MGFYQVLDGEFLEGSAAVDLGVGGDVGGRREGPTGPAHSLERGGEVVLRPVPAPGP